VSRDGRSETARMRSFIVVNFRAAMASIYYIWITNVFGSTTQLLDSMLLTQSIAMMIKQNVASLGISLDTSFTHNDFMTEEKLVQRVKEAQVTFDNNVPSFDFSEMRITLTNGWILKMKHENEKKQWTLKIKREKMKKEKRIFHGSTVELIVNPNGARTLLFQIYQKNLITKLATPYPAIMNSEEFIFFQREQDIYMGKNKFEGLYVFELDNCHFYWDALNSQRIRLLIVSSKVLLMHDGMKVSQTTLPKQLAPSSNTPPSMSLWHLARRFLERCFQILSIIAWCQRL
jgi:hypothetical protein